MKKVLIVITALIFSFPIYAQFKQIPDVFNKEITRFENIGEVTNIKQDQPNAESTLEHSEFIFESIGRHNIETPNIPAYQAIWTKDRDIPLAIHGKVDLGASETININEKVYLYLEAIKDYLNVEEVRNRFVIRDIEADDLGLTHVRIKQYYKGIPIYGGEIMLHFKNGQPYFLNGFWYPEVPNKNTTIGLRNNINLKDIVENDLDRVTNVRSLSSLEKKLLDSDQWTFEKVYYKKNENDNLSLHWMVNVHPNLGEEWTYFINNESGRISHKYEEICKLHAHLKKPSEINTPDPSGAEKAWAQDLLGTTREINVYNHGGQYYLIDASRDMFQAGQGSMPDDPIGVIWTLNAQNTSPETNNFNVEHIHSSNNSWSDKIAVSAHYNAQKAFEYYKTKFSRNSINGQGGNIISLINVVDSDGTQMDNAFWSGKAMFYGNGKDAFYPLAGSLDVAGHEMTHGVIQSTANLEYYGEPGAINESYADVFGCMIDRDDWKLGEDVVFTNVFTSGALRDMSNPHNGGSSLNHNGYQPANVGEQYTGEQDNAGVHINSGIPNHAYYKFATAVGKEKAEQIYYKALTSYLTKSSRFVDLRIAIEQAAFDLYGADEKQAASNAFEAVGIKGGTSSGGENNYQDDLQPNPGNDLILYYDDFNETLILAAGDGSIIQDPFSNTPLYSKPSISDDGSEIVFVGQDLQIHYIFIDWATGQYEENIIQEDPIWRNVIVSKDGWRIAALEENRNNQIHVYDFRIKQWQIFQIYNPSTVEGVTAGAVDFVDVMEFNYSGEWIMYDAQNTIQSEFGNGIEYWDVGFVQVFNNNTGTYSEGLVQKLFAGLPENTSIGNPTFSKNSPYIVAFDYLVGDSEHYILGSNIETGEVSQLYESVGLGYPNYSRLDDMLLFDYSSFFGGTDVAVLGVGENKITYVPNSDKILIPGGSWGTWFANGSRSLILDDNIQLINISEKISINPNPSTGKMYISGPDLSGEYACRLVDMLGNVYYSNEIMLTPYGKSLDLSALEIPNGSYVLMLQNEENIITKKIMINQN